MAEGTTLWLLITLWPWFLSVRIIYRTAPWSVCMLVRALIRQGDLSWAVRNNPRSCSLSLLRQRRNLSLELIAFLLVVLWSVFVVISLSPINAFLIIIDGARCGDEIPRGLGRVPLRWAASFEPEEPLAEIPRTHHMDYFKYATSPLSMSPGCMYGVNRWTQLPEIDFNQRWRISRPWVVIFRRKGPN